MAEVEAVLGIIPSLMVAVPFRHTILLSGALTLGPLFILLLYAHPISGSGENYLRLWPMIYPVRNAELIMPIG